MNLLQEQQYEYHPRDQGPVFLDVHLDVYIECQVKATQGKNVTSSSDSNQEGV